MKRVKTVLSALLAVVMLLSVMPPAFASANDTGFSDVAADAWYAGSVTYVRDSGLMSGTGEGNFSPNTTTTRAMLTAILYRVSGSPAVEDPARFTDVAQNAYYADAVAWASENEIVQGYGNSLFGSNDPVSREQIAAILWRYAGSPASNAGQDFADESVIAGYAGRAVDWARENGIISGTSGNLFDPKGDATRAQVAAMLHRFMVMEENGKIPSDANVLVAYFSASGNTQAVAKTIAGTLDADLFELTPAEPYSNADLNWTESGSRVNREHENESLRAVELTADTVDNWADYDVVFVGYPVWWGIAAWPVNGFIQANDFSGKTVIPFCTSTSSGLGESGKLLAEMAGTGTWLDGQRFRSNVADADVAAWINSLDLPEREASGNSGSANVSGITSAANVPLLTLNNGVQIPQLGLGTQIQRLEGDSSESGRALLNETSHDAVLAALRSGYRHLDTAHGYFNETGVGQAIADSGVPREEIWVTSKLWPSEYGEGVTMEAIDAMLERLGLDYLDCIYLHHPAGDYMGAWRDLEEAYRQGKVRALGISNFDNRPEAFETIMDNSRIKPQFLQIECHPFAQRQETRELAGQHDLQVECWYPLGHADDRLLNNDVLSQIAKAHSKSVVQVILRWHIQEGFSVIPGSANPEHIQENIEIFDFELSDEEMEQIRAMDQGEDGRYFNLDYEQMDGLFTNPIE